MAARITVADLAARLDAMSARQDAGEAALAEALNGVTAMLAQFSTPAPVAEAVSAPAPKAVRTPRKAKAGTASRKTTTTPVVSITSAPSAKATAKTEAERKASADAWRTEKAAVSPVNKALVQILGVTSGADWDARWTNIDAVNAALAAVTPAEAQAALPFVQKRVEKAARS